MSDFSLDADLILNTSPAERQIQAMQNRPLNFKVTGSEGFKSLNYEAANFSRTLEHAQARMIAFGSAAAIMAGVVSGIKEMAKQSIVVEKTLVDVNTILNISNSQLTEFGNGLFNIAKQTNSSFTDVAKGAQEFARQGLSVEETLKRTHSAFVLSQRSGMSAAESTKAITTALYAFNEQGLTHQQVVNKMAAVDVAFAVSSDDLAKAIERVSAVAQDAGVNFDQLLAVVTAAQQMTGRGGSNIANALSTVFTRTSRSGVLDELENIGIAVRDLGGETLPVMQILSEFAQKYDNLSASQRSHYGELLGGVRNLNILKSTLKDLSKEHSYYSEALKVSKKAENEAFEASERMNQTLSARLNRLRENAKQAAAFTGDSLFGGAKNGMIGAAIDTVSPVFEGATKYLDPNKAKEKENGSYTGEALGAQFAQGFVRGIGNVISGPGLVAATLAFVKISTVLVKSFGSILSPLEQINGMSGETAKVYQGVNQLLNNTPGLMERIRSGSMSRLEVEAQVLAIQKQQIAAQEMLASITSGVAGSIVSKGEGKVFAAKAGGYIPEGYADKEISDARKHGYHIDKNDVRVMDARIGGKNATVIYNSKERVIQNYKGSGDTAIIPPNFAEGSPKRFRDKRGRFISQAQFEKEYSETFNSESQIQDSFSSIQPPRRLDSFSEMAIRLGAKPLNQQEVERSQEYNPSITPKYNTIVEDGRVRAYRPDIQQNIIDSEALRAKRLTTIGDSEVAKQKEREAAWKMEQECLKQKIDAQNAMVRELLKEKEFVQATVKNANKEAELGNQLNKVTLKTLADKETIKKLNDPALKQVVKDSNPEVSRVGKEELQWRKEYATYKTTDESFSKQRNAEVNQQRIESEQAKAKQQALWEARRRRAGEMVDWADEQEARAKASQEAARESKIVEENLKQKKLADARAEKVKRIGNRLIGVGIAAPLITSVGASLIYPDSEDPEQNRKRRMVEGVGSAVGTGAMIGSFGGVPGMVVGGLVGSFLSLKSVVDNSKASIEDLDKVYQNAASKKSEQLANTRTAVQAEEDLRAATREGNISKIREAQNAYNIAVSKSDPSIMSLSADKRQEAMDRRGLEDSREKQKHDNLFFLKNLNKESGVIFKDANLWNGDEKKWKDSDAESRVSSIVSGGISRKKSDIGKLTKGIDDLSKLKILSKEDLDIETRSRVGEGPMASEDVQTYMRRYQLAEESIIKERASSANKIIKDSGVKGKTADEITKGINSREGLNRMVSSVSKGYASASFSTLYEQRQQEEQKLGALVRPMTLEREAVNRDLSMQRNIQSSKLADEEENNRLREQLRSDAYSPYQSDTARLYSSSNIQRANNAREFLKSQFETNTTLKDFAGGLKPQDYTNNLESQMALSEKFRTVQESSNPLADLKALKDFISNDKNLKDSEKTNELLKSIEDAIVNADSNNQKATAKERSKNDAVKMQQDAAWNKIQASNMKQVYGGGATALGPRDTTDSTSGFAAKLQSIKDTNDPEFQKNRRLALNNATTPMERNQVQRQILDEESKKSFAQAKGIEEDLNKNRATTDADIENAKARGDFKTAKSLEDRRNQSINQWKSAQARGTVLEARSLTSGAADAFFSSLGTADSGMGYARGYTSGGPRGVEEQIKGYLSIGDYAHASPLLNQLSRKLNKGGREGLVALQQEINASYNNEVNAKTQAEITAGEKFHTIKADSGSFQSSYASPDKNQSIKPTSETDKFQQLVKKQAEEMQKNIAVIDKQLAQIEGIIGKGLGSISQELQVTVKAMVDVAHQADSLSPRGMEELAKAFQVIIENDRKIHSVTGASAPMTIPVSPL